VLISISFRFNFTHWLLTEIPLIVISVVAVLLYFAFPPMGGSQILAEIVRHSSLLTPAYFIARTLVAFRRPREIILNSSELRKGQSTAVPLGDIKEITVRKNLMTSQYGFTMVDKYFQFHSVDAYYLPTSAGAYPDALTDIARQRDIRFKELQPSLFHSH